MTFPQPAKHPFYALFTYKISSEPTSKRVRFVYALKGRGEDEGIVEHYGGSFLAPACFMVPWNHAKDLRDVFAAWDISYSLRKIRIVKEEINEVNSLTDKSKIII